MLGLKKKNIEARKEPEAKEPEAKEPEINIEDAIESIEIGVEEQALKEYEKTAKDIGFAPASLTREKLIHFLKKRNLKTYNYDKAWLFLSKRYGYCTTGKTPKPGWTWVSLVSGQKLLSRSTWWDYPNTYKSGYIDCERTYQKEIPLRTLGLVKEIKNEIPELCFFVSDVAIPRPDPFLSVTCEDMEIIVIDHWDEPTFKD